MAARQLLHPRRPLTKSLVLGGMLAMWIAPSASPVTFEWVPVVDAGNAPDTANFRGNCYSANCGEVDYNYYISKYDVTNAQYAEFLNAKAASDPTVSVNTLYHPELGSDANNGGITQSGSNGSYTYAVKPGFENKPVEFVNFFDALRFVNWLSNGQGTGDTETGSYTITTAGIAGNSITRNPGAIIALPSENEWYKAAYYNPATSSYFAYPAGSNTPTVCALPAATPNTANCNPGGPGMVTDVGAYTGSTSPSGTYDQGGNVWQWTETTHYGSDPIVRGGGWLDGAVCLAASAPITCGQLFGDPWYGLTAFRVIRLSTSQCGDGVIEPPFETCDDGNTVSGDGCSATCQVEPGWTCNGASPTVCTTPIVDQGAWILDESTGLEWLKFSQTSNQSYNQVISSIFLLQGWSYATISQICTLTMTPDACSANPSGSFTVKHGVGGGLTGCAPSDANHPCNDSVITGNLFSPRYHIHGELVVPYQDINSQIAPYRAPFSDDTAASGSFLVRQPPSCGMGGEVALALPLLWLRARRRSAIWM
jgi:formylglycine-generating enzyme